MTTIPAAAGPSLLEVYADHQHLLGGTPSYRLDRVAAARRFLVAHPDLAEWVARPLDASLAELRRCAAVWPFVGFALLAGW